MNGCGFAEDREETDRGGLDVPGPARLEQDPPQQGPGQRSGLGWGRCGTEQESAGHAAEIGCVGKNL